MLWILTDDHSNNNSYKCVDLLPVSLNEEFIVLRNEFICFFYWLIFFLYKDKIRY